MPMWVPDINEHEGPLYLAIADSMARDVEGGRLKTGARLPTHRELARKLGVTVGTVTRGYEEAARRGLVSGEVGRGSFVRGGRSEPLPRAPEHEAAGADGVLDLSLNHPRVEIGRDLLAAALAEVASRADLAGLLQYQPYTGIAAHRAAAAKWLAGRGLAAGEDEVAVTCGAQHGMLIAFSILTEPGDLVLTEALTWSGMKGLARMLRLRVESVAMDEEGILPEALAEACRKGRPRALYCTPTLQNPTARVMGAERRRAIAAVLEAHRLPVVEDDIYSYLVPEAPPPLAALCGDRGWYVTSLSKCFAPGLRVGFLRAPRSAAGLLAATMLTTSVMAPPLMAAVAATMITGGAGATLLARQRQDCRQRQALARRILGPHLAPGVHDASPHLWLLLPEPWRGEEFAAHARSRGVRVASAETYAVGRGEVPHAVRVSLCAAPGEAELDRGLRILADLLAGPPPPSLAGV